MTSTAETREPVVTQRASTSYVVKVEDIVALNFLPPNYPAPQRTQWINRATDQELRHSTVSQFLRTLYGQRHSPSVVRLHETTGLRLIFASETERNQFAASIKYARDFARAIAQDRVTAYFDSRQEAEDAIRSLIEAGVEEDSISLLFRASTIMDEATGKTKPEGHSYGSIITAIGGSGVAGAALGFMMLSVPGIGMVAAAGAVATSTFASVGTVSGIIGATGGAIARMLSDPDVDGVTANALERQFEQGKVFVSAEHIGSPTDVTKIRRKLASHGGRIVAVDPLASERESRAA